MSGARGVSLMALVLLGCPALPELPGSELLGTYSLGAEPFGRSCLITDVSDAPFRFEASISRDPGTGHAWLAVSGYPRDAGWDGQVLESHATVPRAFPSCRACATVATETVRLALLSRSQSEAVGNGCPAEPFDGGVPAADGQDGGVLLPRQTPEGFDALYACGELTFTVTLTDAGAVDPGCEVCDNCRLSYRLVGERR